MSLVLTRRDEESVIIGEEIRITVSFDRPYQAKLVIDAPEDIVILREELLDDPIR